MPKSTGLGDQLFFNGYDISNDVQSVDMIAMPTALLDVTGIDKSAHERIKGLADGEISFTAYFNDAASQAHAALKGRPSTDVQVIYCRGTTRGNPAAAHVAKQINYDPTRGADGSLLQKVQTLSDEYVVEWGKLLTTGKQNFTGAVTTTGVDFASAVFAGSSTLGLAAYLQCFAFTGTSVTVTIQESSDDGATDPYAAVTSGAFAAVSAANTVQRIETSLTQTVERYLRLALSGTFSNADLAVMAIRYDGANRET